MFDSLSESLSRTLNRLKGQGRLTEDNVKDALREVRMALLEADVALPVVRDFIQQVRERAVGQEVTQSLTPGQTLIKIVRDELVRIMGEANEELALNTQPPAVLLVAGLQGSGKTTTVAKLGLWLRERRAKKVLVVSCDTQRPAAMDQLRILAEEVGVDFHAADAAQDPVVIAKDAVDAGRRQGAGVVIVDTAGRLHVDQALMAEVGRIHSAIEPVETLFVIDAMTGQDAVNTARAFDEALPLTGVVLTKADGDARGGAALSVRHVTGKPIKFLGVGERPTGLEPFHPERVASRILGMGDVLSVVEAAEHQVDQKKAQRFAKKLKKGKGFDLDDFRDQLAQIQSMGGLASIVDKLPGMGGMKGGMAQGMDDRQVRRLMAMINAMTPQERRRPEVIKGSRKKRIAAGSGTQIQEVNRLLKQHSQMQKMMKKLGKGGGAQKALQGLMGRMPRGPGA